MLLGHELHEVTNMFRSPAELVPSLVPSEDRVGGAGVQGTLGSRLSGNPGQGLEKPASLERLVASLCHSMRNPLTSIKMRLYSLRRLTLPPDQENDVDVICEEIQYMEDILQGFAEFSYATKRKREKVSLSTIVDEALRLFVHHPKANGARPTVCREQKLPQISADTAKLKEALLNLLFNACEASEDCPTSICIREALGVEKGRGRVAYIQVSDNGTGIPESVRGKLFQPFFTTKEMGTGLGLSITMGIIEAHGGLISFSSREGVGSTFTISLPVGY